MGGGGAAPGAAPVEVPRLTAMLRAFGVAASGGGGASRQQQQQQVQQPPGLQELLRLRASALEERRRQRADMQVRGKAAAQPPRTAACTR